jgi:hypothetical protein
MVFSLQGSIRVRCPAPSPDAPPPVNGEPMAKPNYQYEKRQRELRKESQQEEKRQKKLARNNPEPSAPEPREDRQ